MWAFMILRVNFILEKPWVFSRYLCKIDLAKTTAMRLWTITIIWPKSKNKLATAIQFHVKNTFINGSVKSNTANFLQLSLQLVAAAPNFSCCSYLSLNKLDEGYIQYSLKVLEWQDQFFFFKPCGAPEEFIRTILSEGSQKLSTRGWCRT